MTSIDNWFYEPLGSTSRLALHLYLIVHCDGLRLILTSKYFKLSFCLSHTLCLSAQFPQPIRESCPRVRLLHSAKISASPISLVSTVHSVHLCPHLSAHPRLAASTEIWQEQHKDASSGSCTQRNTSWFFILCRQGKQPEKTHLIRSWWILYKLQTRTS